MVKPGSECEADKCGAYDRAAKTATSAETEGSERHGYAELTTSFRYRCLLDTQTNKHTNKQRPESENLDKNA
jgi:hypothetical protein